MCVAFGVNLQFVFHAEVHIRKWVQQLEELAVGNGAAAVQVYHFQRVIDGGVQFAFHPEGFCQVSRLHDRRNASLPRHIGAHHVHNPRGNALGSRVV